LGASGWTRARAAQEAEGVTDASTMVDLEVEETTGRVEVTATEGEAGEGSGDAAAVFEEKSEVPDGGDLVNVEGQEGSTNFNENLEGSGWCIGLRWWWVGGKPVGCRGEGDEGGRSV
jgi:hypothetical protein